MYRKVVVSDVEGNKIKLEVFPEDNNMLKTVKCEINMPLNLRACLDNIIKECNVFMNANTINKIEVEEVEE